jgi:hypothetical protein
VHDQLNSSAPGVGSSEQSVERLRSEITALRLELATLHSAFLESQSQPRRTSPAIKTIEPPVRPTIYPAAVVVLTAASLLTWQLITAPHAKIDQPAPPAPIVSINTIAPPPPPVTPIIKPSVYRGTLTVDADHPGATVFVNHRNVGQAPVRVKNLRAGAHLVWVESAGCRRWTRVVTVPAEQVTHVSADLEPIAETGPGM